MTFNLLITGASRGIGLEFVHQYANKPEWKIYACCRHPEKAKALKELASKQDNIEILKMDVTHTEQVISTAHRLKNIPIDLLINNAGIYGDKKQTIGNISSDTMMKVLQTNTLAPLNVTEAFVAHLAKSQLKMLVAITSAMGSLSDNTSGGSYAYRASKAALNMVMKSASIDLEAKGIKTLLLHPGWVKTDMGGVDAGISVEESVTGMIKVIDKYNKEEQHPAVFVRYDGDLLAW